MSTGMARKNREPPEKPLAPAAKLKDKMPKICAQTEEKVKFVHFCRICMFNCTKILHKKLAI